MGKQLFTFEELKKLFLSKNFNKMLASCAEHTNDKGYETGFEITKKHNSKRFTYSKPEFGNTFELSKESIIDWIDRDYHIVLDHHFHPSVGIYPSKEDLQSFDAINTLDEYKYISSIGIVKPSGVDGIVIDLLLFQQNKKYFFDEYLIENICALKFCDDEKYALELLKENGLNATHIANIPMNKNFSGFIFKENELQKLKIFID